MNLIFTLIISLILMLNTIPAKADDSKTDELTLRNQLFADVFLLKEGVDHLQISIEILNKRYNNQMDILKGLQNKFLTGSSEEDDGVCDRITGLFNSTFRKYNAFESRIMLKLDEIQDDQTTRLDEILSKQKLNRNCGPKTDTSATVYLMSDTLTEVSEKISKFEEQFGKLEALEAKLNSQQTKLDTFVENQLKVLQAINEKLSKNEQHFEKLGQELIDLKTNLKNNTNHVIANPRPRLPMEVILGLSSANITSLK